MILATLLRVIPTAGAADAAPRAELWPCWQVHDDPNPQPVDTRPWRAFLQRHLRPRADGINLLIFVHGFFVLDRAGECLGLDGLMGRRGAVSRTLSAP